MQRAKLQCACLRELQLYAQEGLNLPPRAESVVKKQPTMSLSQLRSHSRNRFESPVFPVSLKVLKLVSLGGLLPKLNLQTQCCTGCHAVPMLGNKKHDSRWSKPRAYSISLILCIQGGEEACSRSGSISQPETASLRCLGRGHYRLESYCRLWGTAGWQTLPSGSRSTGRNSSTDNSISICSSIGTHNSRGICSYSKP